MEERIKYQKAPISELICGVTFNTGLLSNTNIIYDVINEYKSDYSNIMLIPPLGDETLIDFKLVGEVWVGMSDKMAYDGWDQPDKINKSCNEYGSREQFVYQTRDVYLYFTNSKLTSFQDYRDK